MLYKVILECVVDEEHVEDALAEATMIVRSLCEHPDVWPDERIEDWEYEGPWDDVVQQPVKVRVTQVKE